MTGSIYPKLEWKCFLLSSNLNQITIAEIMEYSQLIVSSVICLPSLSTERSQPESCVLCILTLYNNSWMLQHWMCPKPIIGCILLQGQYISPLLYHTIITYAQLQIYNGPLVSIYKNHNKYTDSANNFTDYLSFCLPRAGSSTAVHNIRSRLQFAYRMLHQALLFKI